AKRAVPISPKNAANKDSSLLTGFSSAYKINARVISHKDSTRKAAKPSRYRKSKFLMFAAVAAASPETISLDGTYASPNPPATSESRNRTPAILAYLCTFISNPPRGLAAAHGGEPWL